jgi:hypothetical protein
MQEKVNVAPTAPSNGLLVCTATRGITTVRVRRALQCYRCKGAEETCPQNAPILPCARSPPW